MAVNPEELAQLERGWPKALVIEVDAAAVQLLPNLRALHEQGYEFRWVQIPRVRSLMLSGWELACDVQEAGRVIYMNHVKTQFKSAQDLVLIMRNATETNAFAALMRGPAL